MLPDQESISSNPLLTGRLDPASTAHRSDDPWRHCGLLNLYRLFLAAIFITLSTQSDIFLHQSGGAPELFFNVSLAYLCLGLIFIPVINARHINPAHIILLSVTLDIVTITLLMHTSGGARSGLGMLLVVTVATSSVIVGGQIARLIAAMATIAILLEQTITGIHQGFDTASFTHAGLLGISLFATAMLAHQLASRLRASEALAQRRGIDLANMSQLTNYIIQRMQTGIIVIDENERLRLINESARRLLCIPNTEKLTQLNQIPEALVRQFATWRIAGTEGSDLKIAEEMPQIQPRFARLGHASDSGTLIFLEDTAATRQQAQQLKLASLGRLTASIAHEIRNPLAAIDQAGQLLDESEQLPDSDRRLITIIHNHSQRVNTIIRNVMQLSRREACNPSQIDLSECLKAFHSDFCQSRGIKPETLSITGTQRQLIVRIDPDQLRMILDNLCDNALRHGIENGETRILIHTYIATETNRPCLEVRDNGPGIGPEQMNHLFEPFFTTSPVGTGLGLYLCRELAECNQAHLSCIASKQGGCFRLTFADPRRRQIV